ncbi:uncharacterized protein OCT59_003063 [Rhizophagus irregularis]|uniref:uncharacterized protein n=1 Tax=Rhizophagus irregularis TaxID=588596 RepID=UPI00332A2EA2|nr:hypothetical protein OCT59_003063 [Rhizophagus irregularis]
MTLEEKDAYLALFKRYKTYRYVNRLLNIEIEIGGRTVIRLENTFADDSIPNITSILIVKKTLLLKDLSLQFSYILIENGIGVLDLRIKVAILGSHDVLIQLFTLNSECWNQVIDQNVLIKYYKLRI